MCPRYNWRCRRESYSRYVIIFFVCRYKSLPLKLGLEQSQIEFLSNAKNLRKIARRDLPLALSQNLSGGTTVSATSFLAGAAGIRFFATGGIGGVHRCASKSMPLSKPCKFDTNWKHSIFHRT